MLHTEHWNKGFEGFSEEFFEEARFLVSETVLSGSGRLNDFFGGFSEELLDGARLQTRFRPGFSESSRFRAEHFSTCRRKFPSFAKSDDL
jgi:hypothetical protein